MTDVWFGEHQGDVVGRITKSIARRCIFLLHLKIPLICGVLGGLLFMLIILHFGIKKKKIEVYHIWKLWWSPLYGGQLKNQRRRATDQRITNQRRRDASITLVSNHLTNNRTVVILQQKRQDSDFILWTNVCLLNINHGKFCIPYHIRLSTISFKSMDVLCINTIAWAIEEFIILSYFF